MSKLNYEITLYHSPYHDSLIEELQSIIRQKKNMYRKIYSENEIDNKLSFEEKEIIKYLTAKEDKILLELIEHKGWTERFELSESEKNTLEKNKLYDDNDLLLHHYGY